MTSKLSSNQSFWLSLLLYFSTDYRLISKSCVYMVVILIFLLISCSSINSLNWCYGHHINCLMASRTFRFSLWVLCAGNHRLVAVRIDVLSNFSPFTFGTFWILCEVITNFCYFITNLRGGFRVNVLAVYLWRVPMLFDRLNKLLLLFRWPFYLIDYFLTHLLLLSLIFSLLCNRRLLITWGFLLGVFDLLVST